MKTKKYRYKLMVIFSLIATIGCFVNSIENQKPSLTGYYITVLMVGGVAFVIGAMIDYREDFPSSDEYPM